VTTYWQPHQVEQLRAIGLRLQQERERQNIILEDVSAKTRIRVALLQGIEAAEINRLPEPVYVRGFIRRFEETLGLPSGELSSQLVLEPTILGNVDPLTTYPPTPAVMPGDSAATKSKKDLKKEKESAKEAEKRPEPTFRQAPLPEVVPAASLPLFQGSVDVPPIDVRPTAKPIEIPPVDLKPTDLKPAGLKPVEIKPVEAKSVELKPVELKPVETKPVVTPKVTPIDPWADEPALAERDRIADRADSRSDIRIVPPPARNVETASERQASDRPAALLPMPQAPKFDEPAPLPWKPIGLGIALLGFLGALGWGAMNLTKSPTIATNQAPTAQVNPSQSVAKPPETVVAAPVKPPTKPVAPVSLTANFRDAAWISVETDGKLAYEGEIPKGGTKTWTAQKGIFFRTGLASVVWLSVNGAPAKQFNSYSGPKDETFLPNSR
jgi:cytoskeleton protein RodZ